VVRDDQTISLQPKAMEVLIYLAGCPSEVVPKERLIQAVWTNTFVTDDVLTHAISELRKAFRDDARNPKFIETVPRRGYRLIAPVKQLPATDTRRVGPLVVGRVLARWWLVPVAVILLGIGWFWIEQKKDPIAIEPSLPQRSILTSLPGNEESPSFSPDGNHVTFACQGSGEESNWDIYVQAIETRELTRRTDDRADDINPAWSPDGNYIAFARRNGTTEQLLLMPTHGYRERVLLTVPTKDSSSSRNRVCFTSAWMPDGTSLISSVPDKTSAGLVKISVKTGEKSWLTAPPEHVYDIQPAVSPDGRNLVFMRELNWTTKDLYLLPLSETVSPRAEPKRLTFENNQLSSPRWSADGASVLYSFAGHLWRIDPLEPGRIRRLMAWGGEPHEAPDFDISHAARRLVFERELWDSNIYRTDRSSSGKFSDPQPVIASTRLDRSPAYSPDGRKVAFVSERSGFHEVWVCDCDGGNPFQLTHFSGPIGGAASWSPDASRIAYDSWAGGAPHIYVASSTGEQATRLTDDSHPGAMPRWSRDGNWIYYTRSNPNRGELWKIPAEGGEPRFVAKRGAWGLESYDGRFVYFYRYPEGIYRVPVEGGQEEFFLKTINFYSCFAMAEGGIFFLSERTRSGSSFLSFYSFSSGDVKPIVEVIHPVPAPTATPDGRSVLFARRDREESDLMLVENFQ